jgi:Family of unknown function (DUF6188)
MDLIGRRIESAAVSDVSPYVVLDLPARVTQDADAALQIDGPVSLTFADGQVVVDPEVGPNEPFIRLVGKTVATFDARDDGGLVLTFADGDAVAIAPFQYEPWQLVASDGSMLISVAGGGLARFPPR